jgi:thioester reductase-like protein
MPPSPVSTLNEIGDTKGKHIIVTGTTGFIGSHTFEALLRHKEVNRVTCLDRKSTDSRTRAPTIARDGDVVSCEYVETDLAEPNLGLHESIYRVLLDSVTDILHCQWAVNFNQPLKYFEPNIQGVNNLIQFACATKHSAQIFFLSSVSAVKNWQRPEPVPEAKLTSPELAEMGYGQSKLIASLLLDQASEKTNVPNIICRLGQVAGSVQIRRKCHAQSWPRRDWFPTLLTTSINLGCLPDHLGSANQVDWIPVDFVAEALSDLICNSKVMRGETNGVFHSQYYNLVNPNVISYTDLTSFLARKLGKGEPLKVVSLQEWVAILVGRDKDSGSFRSPTSGLSLLSFFQRLASSGSRSPLILDTTLTETRLPCLKNAGVVTEEWMEMWLDQWDLI